MPPGAASTSRAWSFSQRFSLRASTLLLLSLPFVAVCFEVASRLPGPFRYLAQFVGAAGSMAWAIAGIAAVLALASLLATVAGKKPQLQFVIEFALAVAFFLTAGRY